MPLRHKRLLRVKENEKIYWGEETKEQDSGSDEIAINVAFKFLNIGGKVTDVKMSGQDQ